MKRVRLVSVTVAPQVVMDDGDTLTPLQAPPMVVVAADWPEVVRKVAKVCEEFEARVNAVERDANSDGLLHHD